MSFPLNSRYHQAQTARVTMPDGREVVYLRQRQPADPASMLELTRHRVADLERLDNISAKFLGDPLLAWLICDGNAAMDSRELTSRAGRVLVIPMFGGA